VKFGFDGNRRGSRRDARMTAPPTHSGASLNEARQRNRGQSQLWYSSPAASLPRQSRYSSATIRFSITSCGFPSGPSQSPGLRAGWITVATRSVRRISL